MTARPLPSPPVAALLGRVIESIDLDRGRLQVRFAARPEFAADVPAFSHQLA